MGVITLDDGRSFKVDDSFGKLPLDQQQSIVGELKQQLTSGVAKQIASGSAPVKSTLQSAAENFIPSATNLVKGTANTAVGAGEALINPDPRAKLGFIKDLAVGAYEGLKKRYGSGLENAFATDPAGVISDVLSLGFGLRGIRSGGGAEVPTRPATRANAIIGRDMAADVANQTATGVGPAPMDRGGTVIANQVERLSNTSASGREVLEPVLTERQEGQLGRIANDLSSLAGTRRTALQATQETMEQRAQAAIPAYRDAYAAGDRAIWSPELERLTSAPAVVSAMRGAQTLWRDNAVADGYGAMNPSQIDRGGQITFGGKVPVFPNIQFWDYTKRIIDQNLSVAVRKGATDRVRVLTRISQQLRTALDTEVPEYRNARAQWSDRSSYLGAIEDGRSILSKSESAEEMHANFNQLSAADQQAYREGAVSAILQNLSNNPTRLADLTRNLRSPAMRQKILTILPTQEARRAWTARLDVEVRSSELVGAGLKGSATARRLAQAADAENLAHDLVLGVLRGQPVTSMARAILVSGFQNVRKLALGRRDREMARVLTGQRTSTRIQQPVGNRAPLLAPALTSQEQQ